MARPAFVLFLALGVCMQKLGRFRVIVIVAVLAAGAASVMFVRPASAVRGEHGHAHCARANDPGDVGQRQRYVLAASAEATAFRLEQGSNTAGGGRRSWTWRCLMTKAGRGQQPALASGAAYFKPMQLA